MRKITYYCDRCGKEAPSVVQIGYRTINVETGEPEEYEFGAELCVDCFDLVDKATMAAVNTKEPPKVKAKKAYSKRDIDMPKVLALRKAGWTFEKIGIEFGVTDQTIINRIRAWEAEQGKEAGEGENNG